MSARREVGEPAEAICEGALRKYGMILTYGTTVTKVKAAGASEYVRGVALADTEDPFSLGTFKTGRRVAYAKEGTVQVFCRGSHPSINIGDAIQSDASGCGTLLPKANIAATSNYLKTTFYASMVGISETKLASNVSGYIDVVLKIHQVPKP